MSESARDEKAIFLAALEQEPGEQREAYLNEACGDDAAILARIRELLASHDGSLGPLDAPPLGVGVAPTVSQAITEKPGSQIGFFKLRERIGEGGMGVVYVADQKEPVQRRVALKIIKPGMDSQQVIARFEAERQALALMDHPNIAKVLDAGTTENGRPYFVMELVNGLPITKYCDEQHLSLRERLELFVSVCQAVQHAHQKGIIHRDLKPSNILVALYDGRPVTKVIDFGVAKATSQMLTEKSVYTQLGQLVGTLEYMSPEQAERNQLDIDTRSDIYSLGVVLYELLTGETPFERGRLRSAAFDEMLRIIREEEPPKPSTKLSSSSTLPSVAANRSVEPQRLRAMMRGELDWVIMKGLEKDRARRYETATGFAADIRRYLDNEPVLACPPSTAYRLRKFASRNKMAFTSAGMVAFALCLGLVSTTWQMFRAMKAEQSAHSHLEEAVKAQNAETQQRKIAEASFQQAIEAIDEMLSEVGETDLASVPQFEPVRHRVLLRALEFSKSLFQQRDSDIEAQFQVALAHQRVGDIQKLLGRNQESLTAYGQALHLLNELDGQTVDVADKELARARTLREMGEAYFALSEKKQAVASMNEAMEALLPMVREAGNSMDSRIEFAETSWALVEIHYTAGDLSAAQKVLEVGMEQFDPATVEVETAKPLLRLLNLAGFVRRDLSQGKAAIDTFRRAIRIANRFAANGDEEMRYLRSMVSVNGARTMLRFGEPTEGERVLRDAVSSGEQLVGDFPRVPKFRFALYTWQVNLGGLLLMTDRPMEALDYMQRAADTVSRLSVEFPDVAKYHVGRGGALSDLAGAHSQLQQNGEAIKLYRQAIEAQREALRIDPAHAVAERFLSNHLHNLADTLQKTDAPAAELETVHRQAVDLARRILRQNPGLAINQNQLGAALFVWGRTLVTLDREDEAIKAAKEAVQLLEGALGVEKENVSFARDCAKARLFLARALENAKDAEATEAISEWVLAARRWSILDKSVIPWTTKETSRRAILAIHEATPQPGMRSAEDWLFLAALHQNVAERKSAMECLRQGEELLKRRQDAEELPLIERYRQRVRTLLDGRQPDPN